MVAEVLYRLYIALIDKVRKSKWGMIGVIRQQYQPRPWSLCGFMVAGVLVLAITSMVLWHGLTRQARAGNIHWNEA